MRTTIDLPDALYRRTKAVAALQGSSMREIIIRAIEREVNGPGASGAPPAVRRVQLPLVHLKNCEKLDLTDFDFDDLLT